MLSLKVTEEGLTAVKGIQVASRRAGLKTQGRDLAIIYSEHPAHAAAVWTTSQIKAASLLTSIKHLESGKVQAIIINSGIANTCTGERGLRDAEEITRIVAEELEIPQERVLIFSTGYIGRYLPLEKIRGALKDIKYDLDNSPAASLEAVKAIMTTDTRPKRISVKVPLGNGKEITLGGMAKGSGMISPNMATMLGFIATDVDIPPGPLRRMLKTSVDKSFNMINVDGDMGSDAVVLLANGTESLTESEMAIFQEALDYVCISLAKMIVRDGEGASKLMEVRVRGAETSRDARAVALSVVKSNLVKCAIYGDDPNIGRVMLVIGASGARLQEQKLDIYLENIKMVEKGVVIEFDRYEATRAMSKPEIQFLIDLNMGQEEAVAWGCDLTPEYVRINSEYPT
ncbi:MAG TPA: bifunctional glutamate N-acetyltransferase/amino-acid acetyltransferase ArgJ [Candidatus Limnocylindrales bacterium]|nr:bifunctional glutamate N-acetyltransferase/amino-acid acetyltransferase ArgJ [Candidatus Limnocylindrales bacterium]